MIEGKIFASAVMFVIYSVTLMKVRVKLKRDITVGYLLSSMAVSSMIGLIIIMDEASGFSLELRNLVIITALCGTSFLIFEYK